MQPEDSGPTTEELIEKVTLIKEMCNGVCSCLIFNI